MKYTLECLNTNHQPLAKPLESSSPFGSYVAGSIFYMSPAQPFQIANVLHAVTLDTYGQFVVVTKLLLAQPGTKYQVENTVPWPTSDHPVPWPWSAYWRLAANEILFQLKVLLDGEYSRRPAASDPPAEVRNIILDSVTLLG